MGETVGMVTQTGAESGMCAWPHGGPVSRALGGRRCWNAVSRARAPRRVTDILLTAQLSDRRQAVRFWLRREVSCSPS